jgi:hypothetical protein
VTAAAPILRFLVGQRSDHCRSYFRRMGWTATIVRNVAAGPV